MAFKEEGSVEYVTIDGKEVPVVKCEAEIVLRNTNREIFLQWCITSGMKRIGVSTKILIKS